MIPVYRYVVAVNFALLGYYPASSGNFLPTFLDNLSVLSSGIKNPKDGTDRLSRKVGNKLSLLAV